MKEVDGWDRQHRRGHLMVGQTVGYMILGTDSTKWQLMLGTGSIERRADGEDRHYIGWQLTTGRGSTEGEAEGGDMQCKRDS